MSVFIASVLTENSQFIKPVSVQNTDEALFIIPRSGTSSTFQAKVQNNIQWTNYTSKKKIFKITYNDRYVKDQKSNSPSQVKN